MALRIVIALGVLVLTLAGIAPERAHAQGPNPCATAAATALAARGASYAWGAKGPDTFDCSGLVYWAWAQAGYDVGLSSYDQARAGVQIGCGLGDLAGASTTCWLPGDLIMLRYSGGQHVAMYIGNGLFADAYNTDAGVILHDPANDPFYQLHYWQSRRITDCDSVILEPGATDAIIDTPGLEQLPDLLGPVSFVVPQCGDCNPDGSVILPPTTWDGRWPTNLLELGTVFQTAISWLAWRITEIIRQLICWLLTITGYLAAFLTSIANLIRDGINGLWSLLLQSWFSFQEWLSALYYLLIDIAAAIGAMGVFFADIWALIILVAGIVAAVFALILATIGAVVGQIIGLIGWVGGLVLGMIAAILQALSSPTVPVELSDTATLYYALRGMLEALRDSRFGWGLVLFWAMAYIGLVYWATLFFSGNTNRSE